ncbi:MAG TPA: hypothetical protein VNL95_00760, partial [Dehalococcoidia bacterium]|nr:hypothetical protein [Dehalococcoidia bacterium]
MPGRAVRQMMTVVYRADPTAGKRALLEEVAAIYGRTLRALYGWGLQNWDMARMAGAPTYAAMRALPDPRGLVPEAG